jgi:broad specificity phosphatase PhoE
MKRPTRIHLVRHGEVHNPDKILYGRLPGFRLSREGHRQAEALGRFFQTITVDTVFSSPMLRTRQTAAHILAYHHKLKRRTSNLLNEVCNPFEGLPGSLIDARQGDVYTFDNPDPCYEQPLDIVVRVKKFLGRTLKAIPGGEIVGVTHGDVIVFTVLHALGFEATAANKNRLKQAGFAAAYPATASITTLTFSTLSAEDLPQLEYLVPWQAN